MLSCGHPTTGVSSMHDNAALARRWFEEVWNQNRQQTIHELGSPDVILHGLGESEVEGSVAFLRAKLVNSAYS